MRIAMAAPEMAPFAKVGGLGDVLGALPAALARLGHEVSVLLPFYRQVACNEQLDIRPTAHVVTVPVGSRKIHARVLRTVQTDSGVTVYFVDCPEYFDRPEIYGEGGRDYKDNAERFVFLCRAAVELWRLLNAEPDVIHIHDWPTGLIPVYVAEMYRPRFGCFQQTATLLTIHNLAYQGQFWHWDMVLTGLDWDLFHWQKLEFQGHLNFLKAAIVYADGITTVSRTYAREILTPEFGHGLDAVLRSRADRLWGIVNGVDYRVWNPAIDPHIPYQYGVETVTEGKRICKAALQRELGLEPREDAPLLAQIGRLDPQKGWDLVRAAAEQLLARGLQYVALGTGRTDYEQWLTELAQRRPGQVAAVIRFDEPLAHRIEAGADMFLMPSRFEPCGLNQLYSLKYGTVPIVRAVGGLADTVTDTTDETLADGTATGFVFHDYEPDALIGAVDRALRFYRDPDRWWRIVRNGMVQDWSWDRTAREYEQVYEQVRRTRSHEQTVVTTEG